MTDIQSQLPVKMTDGTNTAGITAGSALKVDGSAVTQPVSIGSNVTVVGAGSAGTANTGVVTIQGIASMTAVKVDGSAVTQPVSGTVTANAGTGNFNIVGTGSAGSAASGVVTVQGIASMTALKVDGSAVTQPVSGTVAVSSVSGTVTVSQGEVSTGIVTYYGTSAAVANASSGTITYTVTTGKTLYLKQIVASSSGGPCKVVLTYGSGPTTVVVGFYSAASPVFSVTFAQPISIASASSVNVVITNNSGVSQDVYAMVLGREI